MVRGVHILVLVFLTIKLTIDHPTTTLATDTCSSKCGELTVPYPLVCGMIPELRLPCTGDVLRLRTGSGEFRVLNTTATSLVIDATNLKAKTCDGVSHANSTFILDASSPFVLSGNNDFFLSGCNASGKYTTDLSTRPSSCQTSCHDPSNATSPRYPFCDLDCCVLPVPAGIKKIVVSSFATSSCSFSSLILPRSFSAKDSSYGIELLWFVPGYRCSSVSDTSLCSRNAKCINSTSTTYGYNCLCNDGFQGDGYANGSGCTAVDHCSNATCAAKASCVNTATSFYCKCPGGYGGDGTLSNGCKLRRYVYLVPGTILPAGFGVLLGFLFWKCRMCSKSGSMTRKNLKHLESQFEENAKLFTYAELERATKNFRLDLKLGNGSFGTVYKGVLDDNTTVAIKRGHNSTAPRIQQFLNEITILSKVSHPNLVKLLGCCIETEIPILVFEHVPRGTLYEHLQLQGAALEWERRLKIASQTAQALEYLHSAACIYHRDVKSSNILLDEDFTAKVADFGISKLVPQGSTHISTALHGTPGYIDPQYQQNYQLTDKSDVYSFGVVLLELITGQMPVDFGRSSADKNLSTFALALIRSGRSEEIVDRNLDLSLNESVESIGCVANLAVRCLENDRRDRPNMNSVAEELAHAIRALTMKSK